MNEKAAENQSLIYARRNAGYQAQRCSTNGIWLSSIDFNPLTEEATNICFED